MIYKIVAELIIPILLLIYKFKKYNFYLLYNSRRIGHFALNVDIFLRRVSLGDIDNNTNYIIVSPGIYSTGISNKQLLRMQQRHVKNIPNVHYFASSIFYHILDKIYQKNGSTKLFYKRYYKSNEIEFSQTNRVLNFNKKDISYSKKKLEQVGINAQKDNIVCIFARDDAYLRSIDDSRDWSHHSFRNMDADCYIESIEYLIKKGYKVVRVGSVANKPIDFCHKNFIDYSFNGIKNDLLDLFLIYISCFVVGNSSGMTDIAVLFNRPLLIVNGVPFTYAPLGRKDMYIHKKILDLKTGSIVPFYIASEMNISVEALGEEQEFRNKYGLSYVDNTSDEILNAIKDMDLYVKGKLDYNYCAHEYYSKYWRNTKNSQVKSLLSPSWFRNNRELYLS